MAEEKRKITRGVIVEYDFVCAGGLKVLFEAAKKKFESIGCEFNEMIEAKYLMGGNTQGGLAEFFTERKNKHDPAKAARELLAEAARGYTAHLADGITPELKQFVAALDAKGVRVVLETRGNAEKFQKMLDEAGLSKAVAYQEVSTTYGSCKWDAWKRALSSNELMDVLTVAVTASGKGVKSALIAGMSAIAVPDARVDYQDFGGAEAIFEKLDASVAAEALKLLRIS